MPVVPDTLNRGSFDPVTGATRVAGSVTSSVPQTTATDRSGTITLGGTAQELMAANSTRKGWWIQNQSSTDLWIMSRGAAGTTNAAAVQPSMQLGAGDYYEAPHASPYALSIFGATTGQAFAAREW